MEADGMRQYWTEDLKKLFLNICRICEENQEILTELDSRLGDGDMGISMGNGARAIRKVLEEFPEQETDLTKLFLNASMAFNRAAPSTLGTLISFGMMAVGKALNHKKTVEEEEIPELVGLFADTISMRGKAGRGDKTILDALLPYAEVLKSTYEKGGGLKEAHKEASRAAEAGMESTKGIRAKTGRASWLDTRNMEYPDAGAVLCTVIVNEIDHLF